MQIREPRAEAFTGSVSPLAVNLEGPPGYSRNASRAREAYG